VCIAEHKKIVRAAVVVGVILYYLEMQEQQLVTSIKAQLAELYGNKIQRHEQKITLTWAQSVDARIAKADRRRLAISSPATKLMTQYLRSNHQAIVIGIHTALADDPKLTCTVLEEGQRPMQPVIVDPLLQWRPELTEALMRSVREGRVLPPYIVTRAMNCDSAVLRSLDPAAGCALYLANENAFAWSDICDLLIARGCLSIMIEGGGAVIRSMLEEEIATHMVVTIAPFLIGKHGVEISPDIAEIQRFPWTTMVPLGTDAVLYARTKD